MKNLTKQIMILIFSLIAFSASAWEVTGKVIRIEPTWVPDYVLFQLDTGLGGCTQTTWINYTGIGSGQTEPKSNVKAVYIILLASLYTGKQITAYGSTLCSSTNIQPSNQ